MTTLPQDSSASNANNQADGDLSRACPSDPPLELVPAPKPSDARRRFAYIGASVAAALLIGYLSGSGADLKWVHAVSGRTDHAELTQALSSKAGVTSDADDKQKMARLVDAIESLQTQVNELRRSADNLRASERLRVLEAALEQAVEAGKASVTQIARLDKLEMRLAQLERAALDRTQTTSFPKSDHSSVAKSSDAKQIETKTSSADQKLPGSSGAIADYVLERVDGGRAFILRPDGFMDAVVPGDELPGAGRVTSIERRGGGWTVTTTQGTLVQRP